MADDWRSSRREKYLAHRPLYWTYACRVRGISAALRLHRLSHMIGFRFRSSMGRTLLRGRLRRRARPLGDCPRCGHALEASTECWFDADRVMTEQLQSCPVSDP